MIIGGEYLEMYFKLFSFCKCDFKGQPQRSKEENVSHSKEKKQHKEKSDFLIIAILVNVNW